MGHHYTHDRGHNIAHNDSAEDAGGGCNTFCKVFQYHNHCQHQQTQQQIGQGSEVLGPAASGEGVDAHTDEAQSNRQHHTACDYRGEKFPQRLDKKAQSRFAYAAHHSCAHNGAVGQHAAAHSRIGGYAFHHTQKS